MDNLVDVTLNLRYNGIGGAGIIGIGEGISNLTALSNLNLDLRDN